MKNPNKKAAIIKYIGIWLSFLAGFSLSNGEFKLIQSIYISFPFLITIIGIYISDIFSK